MNRRFALYFAFACLPFFSHGQGVQMPLIPEVGKLCPNFQLKNIQYFKSKTADLSSFKGKWLILDFWAPYCIPCIKALPKIDSLQKRFEKDVQFLLVGWEMYNKDISQEVFKKIKRRENINLPIAWSNDLFKKWKASPIPHLVIVDNKGIVQAITYSSEINEKVIRQFLSGEEVILKNKQKSDLVQYQFNSEKPFLVDGNGGVDSIFLFRSILSKWNPKLPSHSGYFQSGINMIQFLGVRLISMYRSAYQDTLIPYPRKSIENIRSSYGKYWINPILEIKDSTKLSPFIDSNRFCYSLSVPKYKATPLYMQEIMKNDLHNYFGYKVIVEDRPMPCWILTASTSAKEKLKTKGEPLVYNEYYSTGFEFKNVPVNDIIVNLWVNNQLEPPFIDSSGIQGNIDITVNADLSNFSEFRNALKEQGLELKMGKKVMKVIVIKD